MNGIETTWAALAADPALGVQAVAWALVHFLWQGALAGLVAAALLHGLRRARASLRYSVAVALFLLMALLPAATAFRLSEAARAGSGASLAPPTPLAPLAVASAPVPAQGAPAVGLAAGGPATPALQRVLLPLLPAVFGAWLLGVFALGLAHLGGWWRLRLLVRRALPLEGGLAGRARDLARGLGIGRAVRFLESAAVPVPAVIGWLRPAVLVPASTVAGLTPWQLEAILAHELAHVRRHDYLVNLLQAAVETLLFYHPAVWWLSNEIRRERENCCDDLAVELCGDRLGYARALADLEGLRAAPSRLALAADGGSLLDRVRRLAGVPAGRPRRSWLIGLLALALVPAGFALRWVSADARDRGEEDFTFVSDDRADGSDSGGRDAGKADGKEGGSAGKERSADAAARKGTWKAEREGEEVRLETTMNWKDGDGKHRWQNGETYAADELVGLSGGPEVRFELRRDAGRFVFVGTFRGDDGSGTFTFEPDAGYLQEMESLGYAMSADRQLEMAIHDVSRPFVREIHALGYKNSSLDTLVQFRIHDVDPGLIRELAAAGLASVPADDLVQLQIHRVSPEFIRGLAQAGYRDLSADTLVQFRIHGVSVEQVRGLEEAGFKGTSADDLVQLQIHGIRAETVRGLLAAGLEGARVDDLVQLQIHGVSPDYLRALTAAGQTSLRTDDLVQFRIHGVDGPFVRKAAERYGQLSPDDLVELKIRGRLDR